MSSSSNWRPRLNGKPILLCPLTDDWVDQTPSAMDPIDCPWSRGVALAGVDVCKEDANALFEAVLALWRLKMCEESGANDPSWVAMVEAWLVSF